MKKEDRSKQLMEAGRRMFDYDQPWYAARCLFRDDERGTYEERTVLIRAASFKEAVKLAEKDAKDYAQDVDMMYQGYVDVFHLFETKIGNGAEIFSLMRKTDMTRDEYLDRYLDDGTERRSELKE